MNTHTSLTLKGARRKNLSRADASVTAIRSTPGLGGDRYVSAAVTHRLTVRSCGDNEVDMSKEVRRRQGGYEETRG